LCVEHIVAQATHQKKGGKSGNDRHTFFEGSARFAVNIRNDSPYCAEYTPKDRGWEIYMSENERASTQSCAASQTCRNVCFVSGHPGISSQTSQTQTATTETENRGILDNSVRAVNLRFRFPTRSFGKLPYPARVRVRGDFSCPESKLGLYFRHPGGKAFSHRRLFERGIEELLTVFGSWSVFRLKQ
jgi:hypothetical protein